PSAVSRAATAPRLSSKVRPPFAVIAVHATPTVPRPGKRFAIAIASTVSRLPRSHEVVQTCRRLSRQAFAADGSDFVDHGGLTEAACAAVTPWSLRRHPARTMTMTKQVAARIYGDRCPSPLADRACSTERNRLGCSK